MTTYSPLLLAHISGGILGLLSGFTSIFARKGSRLHRRSGDGFVLSMMLMALAGGYIAVTQRQATNVAAATFTFYLVTTAWLTVSRKKNEIGKAEFVMTGYALIAG